MLLANALAADLIAAGTRVEGIRVQPSTDEIAGQGYRGAGDVHVVSTDLRVTIRLEDATMGAAFWAERLDQPQDGAPGPSGQRC